MTEAGSEPPLFLPLSPKEVVFINRKSHPVSIFSFLKIMFPFRYCSFPFSTPHDHIRDVLTVTFKLLFFTALRVIYALHPFSRKRASAIISIFLIYRFLRPPTSLFPSSATPSFARTLLCHYLSLESKSGRERIPGRWALLTSKSASLSSARECRHRIFSFETPPSNLSSSPLLLPYRRLDLFTSILFLDSRHAALDTSFFPLFQPGGLFW